MKSGMYPAEIIKRLYNSERLKSLYPDEKERLNHIFAEQVYGLAPTEIIYRIVLSFLLGFSEDIKISKHNLKQLDSVASSKNGIPEEDVRRIFNL